LKIFANFFRNNFMLQRKWMYYKPA